MYKLLITKSVVNENYEQELKDYRKSQRDSYLNHNNDRPPIKDIQVKSLEVELTDEEFKKIKAGVLAEFK